MDKDFPDRRAPSNSFSHCQPKADAKTPGSREISLREEPNGFLPFFFLEVLDRFKSTLNSIKTFTHLSREELNDAKLSEYFYRAMDENIEEIDSVINSLLGYIKINTPVVKANTIHLILDELLKESEKHLNSRKIKIVKKFEQDLPETVAHEAQLRYIFNCVLEYAMFFTPPNGSIGAVTRVADIPNKAENMSLPQRRGRYIEIVILFTGFKKRDEQRDRTFGDHPAQREDRMDLKLLLVEEIVHKNHGIMKLAVDEKKPRTQISLLFPIERRRVVYYPSSRSRSLTG